MVALSCQSFARIHIGVAKIFGDGLIGNLPFTDIEPCQQVRVVCQRLGDALVGDLQGELSLDVDRFELPLGSDGLEHAIINGTLALDNAQFRPDDVLVQILNVAGVRLPPSIRTSQSIEVRMENGRVYHSGLKLPPLSKDEQAAVENILAR